MISDPGQEAAGDEGKRPQECIDDPGGREFQLFPNRRVGWASAPNEWSALLAARRAEGLPVLDLTVSNPSAASLGDMELSLHLAFAEAPGFAYHPQPQGALLAREAVAGWYATRAPHAPAIAVSPERVLLTASSSESYAFLFQALCEPGDEVLAPLPSYPLFSYLAGLSAVRLASYRLRYHGEWQIDFASLEAALAPRTRAIVVVNPNNPTGNYLREDEKRRLLEICAKHRLVLIADEVFEEYPLSPPGDPRASFAQPQEDALCVSLGGLSKSAGLPQMKTGWMVLTGPAAAVEELRERLLLVADTYLSVSTPVQAALPRLLNLGRTIGDAIRQRTRANLEFLRKSAAAAPHLTLLSTGGGWNAVLRLPSFRTDAEWSASLLNETGVLAQPGYLYDFEGEAWLVLSLLSNDAVFEEGVLRLGAHVEEATRLAAHV